MGCLWRFDTYNWHHVCYVHSKLEDSSLHTVVVSRESLHDSGWSPVSWTAGHPPNQDIKNSWQTLRSVFRPALLHSCLSIRRPVQVEMGPFATLPLLEGPEAIRKCEQWLLIYGWDSALDCVGKENSRQKRSDCLMSGPLEAEWDSPASCVLRGWFQGKESEGIRTK